MTLRCAAAFAVASFLVACQPASNTTDNASQTPPASAQNQQDAIFIALNDQAAFNDAVSKARPGDTIMLANGRWKDFEILFEGNGQPDNPIRLTAETKGKVLITGQSNLRLAGEHLEVSGLVFKDGFAPTQDVISFRKDKNTLANNSRVTEVVIDNYNQAERREVDFWVMIYGKNNRFDHNHLVGKRNAGVTMAVRLNTEDSRENNHRIDHNYFGPRQILGSNGGETLRVGTSHYSLSDSLTTVENNYFDRADGELEIISNKSGKNKFIGNVFYQSRGTLTMRHGNNNLVEGNVFFGGGVDHTGGIRVINAGQTIRNNYMEGVTGSRFGGALVVMNGVPNSPINRYHQVKDAVIENNTLINSDNIQLGAGSDEERSAVPMDSRFANNLIYSDAGKDVFTVYDDMSGVSFENNAIDTALPKDLPKAGFKAVDVTLRRAENGLFYPSAEMGAGIKRDVKVISKDDVGPSWYPKSEPVTPFASGKTISVSPAPDAIFNAVAEAEAGDVIKLAPGDYTVSKFLRLDKPLTFSGAGSATIFFERTALFEILDGGSLQIDGLTISGVEAPDYTGNSVIRTQPYAMLQNYRLDIKDTDFVDMDVNRSFNIISGAKGTFADYINMDNVSVKNISGAVLSLSKEDDDYGIYNAEYVTITGSQFEDIGQELIRIYRGGTDESTFGPHFTLKDSTVKNVGNDKRNKSGGVMLLHGVQVTDISGTTISDSPAMVINHTVGEPKTRITQNTFNNAPAPKVMELNSAFENTAIIENNQGL